MRLVPARKFFEFFLAWLFLVIYFSFPTRLSPTTHSFKAHCARWNQGSKSDQAERSEKNHLIKYLLLRRSCVEDLLEGVLHFLLVEPPGEEGSRRLRRGQLDGLFVDDADAVFVVVVVRRTDPAKD